MTEHIAFYGKGGTGKSTSVTNLAAALAEAGHRVLLIGCDPKADTASLLHQDATVRPVLELSASGGVPALEALVAHGFLGIAAIEVGNAMASGTCVAHGINRALALLLEIEVFTRLQPDFVLYDMPGETGCLGFSTPQLDELIGHTFLVTSADLMSLYAANGFLRQLHRQQQNGDIGIGIIANGLNGPFEEALVGDFARLIGIRVAGGIPRSLVVRQCELYGKTVMEAAPSSNLAFGYRRLALKLADPGAVDTVKVAKPQENAALQLWARKWGDHLGELELGIIVEGGSGI